MTDIPRYVLNVNPGGADVMHRNPREECNLDDAEGRQELDPDTAEALLAMDDPPTECQHCMEKP